VAPKNPAISLLVSFFIPGVGSMINGDVGKGVAILVGYIFSWFLMLIIIGIFGVFGFWVWGMIDAYQGAVEWNRRHGIVS
jgi:TM2 domain-containing membrane protein YozV